MSKTGTAQAPQQGESQGKPAGAAAAAAASAGNGAVANAGALEIRDDRTGASYSVPIMESKVEGDRAIRGMDLRQIKTDPQEFGLMSYDPAFMNTASCKSAITFIDGDKGILRYRGYPIEQLAEGATFLETAWLLRHGELPTQKEYGGGVRDIEVYTYVHEGPTEVHCNDVGGWFVVRLR